MNTRSGDTHLKTVGYILWLFGFTGAHRFYYGKPISGTIWFLTLGLLLVGWLIDLFLIPGMDRQADRRYVAVTGFI
jgi:TM2 domain-containing membrane protein YozV